MFSLLFCHGHAHLGDWASVFSNFFAQVTIEIVSPVHKDWSTRQQGPPGHRCLWILIEELLIPPML